MEHYARSPVHLTARIILRLTLIYHKYGHCVHVPAVQVQVLNHPAIQAVVQARVQVREAVHQEAVQVQEVLRPVIVQVAVKVLQVLQVEVVQVQVAVVL